MNSAVRVRPMGAAEDQPSMSLFLLDSAKERNRQGPRPPPPSSSQRAATPAQRAVKTAASAENPVSETPAANHKRENVSSACAQSRSSRWNGGASAGAGGPSASTPGDRAPPR